MLSQVRLGVVAALGVMLPGILGTDDIGFGHGVVDVKTKNWDIKIVKDSGTLASLKPVNSDFDFLPYEYMLNGMRLENGSYHWGDINIRYRDALSATWSTSSSAAQRKPVINLNSSQLVASDMSPTIPLGPLNITREWIEVAGDLGLQFTIQNSGNTTIELGSLGFPAAVNSIFTNRNSSTVYGGCSLMDPYVGLDGGHLRVTPLKGTGPALVVVPLDGTPLEGYRFLEETYREGTRIQRNTWEGFFEWQVYTKAYAEKEWKNAQPWNLPTSLALQPGESRRWGVRFALVKDGVPNIDAVVRETGTPTALSVPGYILPRDLPAKLALQYKHDIESVLVAPFGALDVLPQGNKTYTIRPSDSAWGRVRLTIKYQDGKLQTIHYYITKPASEAVSDLGRFLANESWYTDLSDPFGRAPSPMGFDGEKKAIVVQESRVMVAGLSDEAGAGSYASLAIKQAFQPNADEISKLETFVDKVLYGVVQNKDYTVKRGVFWYEPSIFPNYTYDPSINWSRNPPRKAYGDEIDRAYNYVWPAACYWALYRAGRSHNGVLKLQSWEWYLNQAYLTVVRGMQPDIGFADQGLMGETVFGEILSDLTREGKTEEAAQLTAIMRKRLDKWLNTEWPFGSEQAWDSTGQEGVYYWATYFGETALARKTINAVTGYMPTVPHWAYNGNARRYWDFTVGGKTKVVERQIHHYGSGLNALTMLASYRNDPAKSYLLRVGYAGTTGPLSNIHQNGWASCAMHAWPQNLYWDGYSGDYGPNFVGLALGSGTYLAEDADMGLVAYGGILTQVGQLAIVDVRDAVRQKVFIGPIGLEIKIDAGIIKSFTYDRSNNRVSVKLVERPGAPKAGSSVMWLSEPSLAKSKRDTAFKIKGEGARLGQERQGTKIPLSSEDVEVTID